MSDYDAIEAVYSLWRNRAGTVVRKEPIALADFKFLVDKDGNVPEYPYPSYQCLIQDVPHLMTKQDVEIQWKEQDGRADIARVSSSPGSST